MACLIDTSVLARLANIADASNPVARQAVLELRRGGQRLHVSPQILIEFRCVATRPAVVNGLGLSAEEAERRARGFEAAFPLLPDTPEIYPLWKALVSTRGVVGKQVHDARLVAVCQSYKISHLLTFNAGHFRRSSAA
jgi:predicted nucleic acid-binding protein